MDLLGTVLSAAQTLNSALSELKEALSWLSMFSYESEMDDVLRTVESLTAVLRDAETKQQLSEQARVYIIQIKDVVFDADDLIDELLTHAHQQRIMDADSRLSLRGKLSHFFSKSNPICVSYWMSRGIKDVKKKLDDIAYNNQFSFKIDPQPIRKRSRETCSYVNEVEIIGRQHDLDNIVGKLLASDNQSDVSVLSIVGMGGLGKTALAQLVYNDPRVENAFPLKLWTCVSDQDQEVLDVKDILSKILASTTHNKPDQGFTMDQVQSQLRSQLADQKYLLILDDVWTENRDHWCKLSEYLIGYERGSWILVTTRSLDTASITGGQIHKLSGLSEENSWHLFERTAFATNQSNPLDHDELVRIGRKIVDGCARVPLAIRVAGTLLYGQDKNKWLSIQNIGLNNIRDANNGIVPILELSFHHLESQLKNCFRYCAVFPKDYEIKKEVLIRLWMAQGYIVPFDIGQSIEDTAEDYFSILLKRCFFQDIKKNEDGDIESCKIHDLMHDIAQKVSGKEFNALNTISGDVDKKVRHLSILNASQFEKYCSLLGSTHIRSFLLFNTSDHCHLALDGLVKSFKCLRVLDFSDKNIECLPDSIGELLHLRYMDLSRNKDMKVIPNSITKLCNLQTLILSDCVNLKELPKDLSRLVKLRVLAMEDCHELRWMPGGMGKLTCLHTLKGLYTVGGEERLKSWKQWLDGLKDLKSLVNLKGRFHIVMHWPEKSAKNDDDVKEDELREGLYLRSLEHLDNLVLRFFNSGGMEDERLRMRVMKDLQPHSNIKSLTLWGYNGVKIPCWLTLLPHLVHLHLENCKELKFLPCLGKLCHLKSIVLIYLFNLEYMIIEDSKVLSSTGAEKVSSYPSLEELNLDHLPKLKGWRNNSSAQVLQQSLPQLKKLKIYKCEEFTCSLFCSMLEFLELRYFNEGMRIECTKTNEKSSQEAAIENRASSTHHVPKLRELTVTNGAWLESMPMESFHSLQTLRIEYDHKMEELPNNLQYSYALQTLQIKGSENLKAMPNWMPKLTSLEKLQITPCSRSLGKRCKKNPPGEDWPLIQHIYPNIRIY